MIALHEGQEPVAEVRKPRSPRRSGGQGAKCAPVRVAKSRDAGKTKVSFYLDAETAGKVVVGALMRGVDQSDLANDILSRALSAIVFYDRTRAPAEPLTVDSIDVDSAA